LGDRRAKIGFGKKGKRQKAKTLGGIFLPRVFIVPLSLRNPQGRQHLELLPALWISRNFVEKEKKEKKIPL